MMNFYNVTRLVMETGSPNSICTGYDENEAVFMDEHGTVRFQRLQPLENQLSERFPSYSFCVYTSNQRYRQNEKTELEVYVHRDTEHYLITFATNIIEIHQVVNVWLHELDTLHPAFNRIQKKFADKDAALNNVKEMAYAFLQEMPDHRLWFATQNIELWEG